MGGNQLWRKQNTIAQSCLGKGIAACNRLVTRSAPVVHCQSSQDVDALPLARHELPAQVGTAPVGRAMLPLGLLSNLATRAGLHIF